MQDETKPIGFVGWALLGLFGVSAIVIAAAIWQWARAVFGPGLDVAGFVAVLVLCALLVGFLAGQESRGE